MHKLVFTGLFIFSQCLVAPYLFAESNKDINIISGRISKSASTDYLEMLYTEAFKRLGYKFNHHAYPSKRSSQMTDSGLADGQLSRVFDYANKHPNVIRVKEPHYIVVLSL